MARNTADLRVKLRVCVLKTYDEEFVYTRVGGNWNVSGQRRCSTQSLFSDETLGTEVLNQLYEAFLKLGEVKRVRTCAHTHIHTEIHRGPGVSANLPSVCGQTKTHVVCVMLGLRRMWI